MKQEIEHIQHVIEKDRLQMLKDFEDWWEQQSEQAVRKRIIFIFKIIFYSIGTTTSIISNESTIKK